MFWINTINFRFQYEIQKDEAMQFLVRSEVLQLDL